MAVIVEAGSSPLSTVAVSRAVEEARLRHVPLVLVSQVAMPRSEGDAALYQRRRTEAEANVAAQANDLRARGVACTGYVPSVPTSPAEAVLAAAQEHDARLIVVGTRRRSRVGKALLGSTAQDILLRADCPVLAVKLPQRVEESL